MFMYSLTLKPPTATHQAIVGQFTGTNTQQILTVSGSRLTLKQPDHLTATITDIVTHDCFGIIRKLAAFRLAGAAKGTSLPTRTNYARLVIFEACRAAPPPSLASLDLCSA